MELKEILSKCDHTLLTPTATWKEIREVCDDGAHYGCASVCIPGELCASGGRVSRRAAAGMHGDRIS